MNKAAIAIIVIILAVVVIGFVVIPAVGSTGYSMSVQNYDAEGNPVGAPIGSYSWIGPNGEPVSSVEVKVTWTISLDDVDPSSISVSVEISVSYGLATIDSVAWSGTDTEGDHSAIWDLDTLLDPGDTVVLEFTGTINASGVGYSGEPVSDSWTDSVSIKYTYSEGTITIEGTIGV
ncbi:MAG: hypothetical protein ACFFF4_09910 [Candidatus Thorarchaeota archaeon]